MKEIKRKNIFKNKYEMVNVAETKEEAIFYGLKNYSTGKPCRNGHLSVRDLWGQCKECLNNQPSRRSSRVKKKQENYYASLY